MIRESMAGISLETAEIARFQLKPVCPACGRESVGTGYCPGKKPPSEEVTVQEINPFAAFTGGAQSKSVDVRYACSGISRPHLHRNCSCGHQWLSELSQSGQMHMAPTNRAITAVAFLLCLSGAFWFGSAYKQRADEDLIRTAFNFGARHSITEMTGEVNDQMTALKEALMQYMVRDAERRYKSQDPAEQ